MFDREFGEYGRYKCFYDAENNDYRELDEAELEGVGGDDNF